MPSATLAFCGTGLCGAGFCGAGLGACAPLEPIALARGAPLKGPGYVSAGLLLADPVAHELRTSATNKFGLSNCCNVASVKAIETSKSALMPFRGEMKPVGLANAPALATRKLPRSITAPPDCGLRL